MIDLENEIKLLVAKNDALRANERDLIDRLQAAEYKNSQLLLNVEGVYLKLAEALIKLDEAEKQKPIYQYSNTHSSIHGNLWTDCDSAVYSIMKDSNRRIVYAKPIPAQQSESLPLASHDSDCAVHNMPAYPNGDCNCSLMDNEEDV